MVDNAPDELREMPPSAKLVFVTLHYEGPLTQGQIADESLLPTRTVRYALETLREEDLVERRFYIQDARKRLYALTERDEQSESAERRRVMP
ncbi:winged helix-turn-helix domain-containing protein [Halopelagius longus]|uniref:ArsR family transcriptional regulator n=1 Tax=Halopelagius longus TaxID=1236180 RepID=A0A1H1GSD7_9EURY|nr:winged helix-turn-helix domain-containing protein [Halopelagius longus]RDI69508.1 ArsR family transcriptional regulator [Halopelagius longus]SDR16105.1 hypothetical protein SAMN05216278_3822 [Halopelagius longus]